MSLGGSKPQQQGPTAQEEALTKQNIRNWNVQVTDVEPMVDRYVDITSDTGYASDQLKTQGAVTAAQNILGSEGDKGLMAATINRGSGLSAGNTVAMGQNTNMFSDVVAQNAGASDLAARGRKLGGLQKVISIGRGLSDASNASLAAVGRNATENAIAEAQAKLNSQQQLIGAASSAAGMYAREKNLQDKV
jgi:hypothetical protein